MNRTVRSFSDMARVLESKYELRSRKTVRSFDEFFRTYPPTNDYVYGKHTHALLAELDKTTRMIEAGESRYLCVTMPPRHGKSDIVSRRYPNWHLIRNPNHEIILASYSFSLASELSYELREQMRTIGPVYGIGVKSDRSAIASWRVTGHRGALHASGIGGSITGKGAHILIVDDYFKNREEAESEGQRKKRWESFESDLLTRLAPVHATIIVANRWHEDDIVGRIIKKNDPESDDYNPEFPVFEIISFPAIDEEGNWLFPERFTTKWYETQRAFMGAYSWNAQALQNPQPRTGNMLRADMIQRIDIDKIPKDVEWMRGWDIASSGKERMKDDPDFSVGTLAAYYRPWNAIFVRDVQRGQWSTLDRDRKILATAEEDGASVTVRIEAVAGYVDTYNRIRSVLSGKSIVRKVTPERDKVARASTIEPIFESGKVFIVTCGGRDPAWVPQWIPEFLNFPGGSHDDQVDSLVIAVYDQMVKLKKVMQRRINSPM